MKKLFLYGKSGCTKCNVLKSRLERMKIPFEYIDILEPSGRGMVRFCREEILNPQRIPSIILKDGDNILGYIQTDYSKNGVITPKEIEELYEKEN